MMKKYYSILVLLSVVHFITGQVLVTESFETAIPAGPGTNRGDCGCLTVPDQFTDNGNDYYGRQTDATITANGTNDYSGESGSAYFAGEDHDDANACTACNSTLCFTMDNIVVPNPGQLRNYEVSFLAGGNDLNSAYETDEFLSIEYSVDDQASWASLKCFTYTLSGPINVLSEDADCIQPGDGINILRPAFASYSATFSAQNPTNNRVHLRVCAESDFSSEEWAIDLIRITDLGALPVELNRFEAVKQGRSVGLFWETSSESENFGFEVQSSHNAKNWAPIGFVEGQGTSSDAHSYSFTDSSPMAGINYYRLKQVDLDGSFEYSQVKSVQMIHSINREILFHPNPANNKVHIIGQLPDRFFATLTDVTGNLVREMTLEDPFVSIAELPSGLYFLSLHFDDKAVTKKVVKE